MSQVGAMLEAGAFGENSARFSRVAGRRFVTAVESMLNEPIAQRIRDFALPQNEAGVDPFGFDPDVGACALAFAALLHRVYFRTEVFGLENVPPGRTMLVANHSGQVPIDGILMAATLALDAEPPRLVRSMVERWAATLPYVSYVYPRIGQVVGSKDNALRLLKAEQTLLVFPEGVQGIAKPFRQRYRLGAFSGGFARLARETSTPLVPVAIIGGEEQYPSLGNIKPLAKLLGMPVFPFLPQFLLGMVLPLPTRYRIYFGKPIYMPPSDEGAGTDVQPYVNAARDAIGGMLRDGLAKRSSIFS